MYESFLAVNDTTAPVSISHSKVFWQVPSSDLQIVVRYYPILRRNGAALEVFEDGMRSGNWKAVLFSLAESLTIWKNSFADCLIEDLVIQGLMTDASTI